MPSLVTTASALVAVNGEAGVFMLLRCVATK